MHHPDGHRRAGAPMGLRSAQATPLAPPVVRPAHHSPPVPPAHDEASASDAQRRRRPVQTLLPPTVSFALHAALLLVLAMTVISHWPERETGMMLVVSSPLTEGQLRGSQSDLPPVLQPATEEASAASSALPDLLPIPSPLEATQAVTLATVGSLTAAPLERAARNFPKASADGQRATGARLNAAADVDQAMGGVLGEIVSRLEGQDLLVVWLFDASLSLSGDRQQIAARLTRFFAEHEDRSERKRSGLMSAAVAFSNATVEIEPPTRSGKRIVEAIARVPNDTGGVENVCAAVKWAVDRYHKRKGQLMLVVWTDESGDDLRNLEATIQTCNRFRTSVSVVGPMAVLGRTYGRQIWVQSGLRLSLPVNRGPDTAVSERLYLPYWFDTVFPVWGDGDAGLNQLPAWYGGAQLESLLCGLGPYGLIRLTVGTGGNYTLLDRAGDRNPFGLELMRPYVPSYPSASKYQEELRQHPLREAVMKAVEATLGFKDRSAPGPDIIARQAAALKDELAEQQAAARQCLAMIDKALAAFGPEGMEKEYAEETSRRWRAWYDLTRGRLLAGRVRYKEYELVCAELPHAGKLGLDSNAVTLFPSTTLRGGQAALDQMVEAKRLLKRCLLENSRTPWAYLAARELDHAFGLSVQVQAVSTSTLNDPRSKSKRPQPSVIPPRL
jgi:hypothetical protein